MQREKAARAWSQFADVMAGAFVPSWVFRRSLRNPDGSGGEEPVHDPHLVGEEQAEAEA